MSARRCFDTSPPLKSSYRKCRNCSAHVTERQTAWLTCPRKALVCTALLEDDLLHSEEPEKTEDFTYEESAIVKTAYQGR